MNLNLQHLYYFMIIAEKGSVSGAAEFLSLGQPTLSSQLKLLEEHFGASLFERKNKRLFLNELGHLVLDYARNIFRLGSELEEAVKSKKKTSLPTLRIAALDNIPKTFVHKLAQKCLQLGSCNLLLAECRGDELMREISAHRVDLALSNFSPEKFELEQRPQLVFKLLLREPVSIFGSKEFMRLQKNFPESLQNSPMLLPSFDSKLRTDLEHSFKAQGIFPRVLAEIQDTALKRMMAVSGMALLPASFSAIADLIERNELFKIGTLQYVFEEFFLISQKTQVDKFLVSEVMNSFEL